MQRQRELVFSPDVPPDLQHATLIREEAIDWLESHYPGVLSFTTGHVLRMAGERERRWLITRLREKDIGNEEEFSISAAADALTVLFLRSKGVRFREAVDAVVGGSRTPGSAEPKYGGIWNRLIDIASQRLDRLLTARLLGSAVFSLLRNQGDHPNCLFIVNRQGPTSGEKQRGEAVAVDHEYVYRRVLERPAPSCWVLSPFREVLHLETDQLPTRAEVRTRHFLALHVRTEREVYELLLGTMGPASVSPDDTTLQFVGRILDIVFIDFEEFLRAQSSRRFETAVVPGLSSSDDLQLWLITQLLETIYPGSLSEVIDTSQALHGGRALASSASRPWEPSLWDPPKSLEMLSGYASRIAVPLVVERVEHPWIEVIKSVGPEMRYLQGRAPNDKGPGSFSSMALPIVSGAGGTIGSLYLLMPGLDGSRLDVEVRMLTVFSRIIGETIERQRAAIHSAAVSANAATSTILDPEQTRAALRDLLRRMADEAGEADRLQHDMRLPFVLLSAHISESEEFDPVASNRLRDWLVDTLRHLEWRSFVGSHWPVAGLDEGAGSFMGELPGVGVMIVLGKLVSKDELDRIRNAFPTKINRISPTNAPVKLVAYVLDVPAQRIADAAERGDLEDLADDVERWAMEDATVVDDVAQSYALAHDEGEWDAALRRVRQALQKEGGRTNAYLRRIAGHCSFSSGDWPAALKYAQEAATLSRRELGSGLVRSLCLEADAHLCLCNPVRAWDLYSEAASLAPAHPLPRYFRGQGLLLIARLLDVYQHEGLRAKRLDDDEADLIDATVKTLANGAMEDLTSAADLLDRWGLIPETYQYKNFHLVPTLMGQGAGYLLTRSPGPAAARLQAARRSFPKDDLFFREFLFAKYWEQGIHRGYGALLAGDEWAPLRARLHAEFGEAEGWQAAVAAV